MASASWEVSVRQQVRQDSEGLRAEALAGRVQSIQTAAGGVLRVEPDLLQVDVGEMNISGQDSIGKPVDRASKANDILLGE